jgi:hypothetical protein
VTGLEDVVVLWWDGSFAGYARRGAGKFGGISVELIFSDRHGYG